MGGFRDTTKGYVVLWENTCHVHIMGGSGPDFISC